MVFTRDLRFKVTFDWYTGTCSDRLNETLDKTYDLYKNYRDKEEAHIGGTLEDWCERAANFKAIKAVSSFVGADEPTFGDVGTWLDIHDVNGSTYSGCNIQWEVIKCYEPPEIPADIRANIEVMLRFIRDNLDNVDYITLQLIPELDTYLTRYGLTRNDIKDMIRYFGLENVLRT